MIPFIPNRLILFLSLCALFSSGSVMAAEYAHEITAEEMTFAWTVNGANLDIKLSAKTAGWVAVGFNPSKKMKDANIIIGYVKNYTVVISDEFGSRKTAHREDTHDGGEENVFNKSGSEKKGITTLEFSIPLNSGDIKDTAILLNGETTVILAYGPDVDSFRTRHIFRTSKTVNLSTGANK